MIRVAVTAGMLVIALAFIDSARSDEVPLLNIHSDNFEAIAGWQSGEAQVISPPLITPAPTCLRISPHPTKSPPRSRSA